MKIFLQSLIELKLKLSLKSFVTLSLSKRDEKMLRNFEKFFVSLRLNSGWHWV